MKFVNPCEIAKQNSRSRSLLKIFRYSLKGKNNYFTVWYIDKIWINDYFNRTGWLAVQQTSKSGRKIQANIGI